MTTRTPRLVLASRSPARRRLLRDAGFAPVVDVSGADESFDPGLGTAGAVCVLTGEPGGGITFRHAIELEYPAPGGQ